jgi:hypothetical protein
MTEEGQTPEPTQETSQTDAPTEGQQAQEATPDIHAQMNERFDQLSGQMQQWMSAQQQQQEDDGWQDDLGQQDEFGQFGQEQQQEIDPAIAPYVQQQQALQQSLQTMQEGLYQRDIQDLQDEYPDLRTPEVANPVVQMARQLTQQARPSRMALEMAYKALQADKIAEQQASQQETSQNVAVEGAGAETPAQEVSASEQFFGPTGAAQNPVFGLPLKQ